MYDLLTYFTYIITVSYSRHSAVNTDTGRNISAVNWLVHLPLRCSKCNIAAAGGRCINYSIAWHWLNGIKRPATAFHGAQVQDLHCWLTRKHALGTEQSDARFRCNSTLRVVIYASARPEWQAKALCSRPVRSFVRPTVTKLLNTIFWTRMIRFWCQLAKWSTGKDA